MKVVVIGAGAAGMLAAIISKRQGNDTTLIEKTSTMGNKLKITGKGRCNLTFNGDITDFEKNVVLNSKFLRTCFYNFDNNEVVNFFNKLGVETKVERGGRIFPVSDKAIDVVNALKNEIIRLGINVVYNSKVTNILTKDSRVIAVEIENGKTIDCEKCILSTGGKSYKVTGSTGDGYNLAEKLGHKIKPVIPGLVPLRCYGDTCKKLQGLSLKNVSIDVIENNNKVLYNDFGELLFTHFGLSGPVILSASSKINRIDDLNNKLKNRQIIIKIDLKPSLSYETLDRRICRDFDKYTNKEFKNSLNDLLPQKMIPVIVSLSNIDQDKKVNQITKSERENLVDLIKNFNIYVSDLMPIDYAIISCGGIATTEINPKTMESKLIKGLYFAGEIIDLDAYTGGYNLQIAFSTAYAAGKY